MFVVPEFFFHIEIFQQKSDISCKPSRNLSETQGKSFSSSQGEAERLKLLIKESIPD
jgi:hypothetical protein